MFKINFILGLIIFSFVSLYAAEKDLVIDKAHTDIGFKVKHLMITNVKGNFTDYTGTAKIDDKTGKVSAISIVIETKSINTNESDRDKHLKSPDFFDVTKFPKITFTSDGVVFKQGKNTLLKGKITIRNIEKDITLKVTFNGSSVDPWGNIHFAFEGEGKINRKDFGLNWNKTLESGGVLVGEEVQLVFETEFLAK